MMQIISKFKLRSSKVSTWFEQSLFCLQNSKMQLYISYCQTSKSPLPTHRYQVITEQFNMANLPQGQLATGGWWAEPGGRVGGQKCRAVVAMARVFPFSYTHPLLPLQAVLHHHSVVAAVSGVGGGQMLEDGHIPFSHLLLLLLLPLCQTEAPLPERCHCHWMACGGSGGSGWCVKMGSP